MGQFHRFHDAVDNESRSQAGTEPEKQHLASLVAPERLHRSVVDHLRRLAESLLKSRTRSNPGRGSPGPSPHGHHAPGPESPPRRLRTASPRSTQRCARPSPSARGPSRTRIGGPRVATREQQLDVRPPTSTARIFCSASFDIGRSRPSLRSCSHQLGKAVTHAVDLDPVHVQLIVARPPCLLHLSHEHEALQVQYEVVELAETVRQSASAVARRRPQAASSNANASASSGAASMGADPTSVTATSAPKTSRPVST
jgi:hypothetical protein